MSDELPPKEIDRLAKLSKRGTARGADAVFAAAVADSGSVESERPIRVLKLHRTQAIVAIAATVMLLGGVAAAIQVVHKDDKSPASARRNLASGATTTSTTGAAAETTTIDPATRVFLTATRLVPFDQCPSLASYAKAKALDVVGPYGLPGGNGGMRAMAGSVAADGAGAKTADGAAATAPQALASTAAEHSDTNVQEAGIDEPDSVKTDGKTIFTVNNGRVFATSVQGTPGLIGEVPIQNARELLLVGSKLIVISDGGYYALAASTGTVEGDSASSAKLLAPGGPYPYQPTPSRFTVIDVHNPHNMAVTGSYDVEGSYVSARLVDGVARLVVRSAPELQFTYPADGSPEAAAAATAANKDKIRAATNDTWLPHFSYTNAAGKRTSSKALTTCANSYRPPSFSGFGMLSVITFNAAAPAESHATSVMADGDIVYASNTRMYVATNSWGDVDEANGTFAPSATTLIHSFDISDPANATYRVSGRVRGTVLNQFSLSEYDGVLRLATTDPNGGSESFMTTLKDDGNALQQIGQVGGLGKGERIYAVRFIDKTAYVVTFRQVDPLYIVDLSQPTAPRVISELALSGYSAYLHPIGPGLLLGIGQEATAEGRRAGIQASIFDVRNPAAPRLVARKVLEQGSSSVEFDHHAFLYWAPTKLAVLPINIYDQGSTFSGAVGLRIGDDSIDEIGRMSPPPTSNGAVDYSGIERSVVIGDRLFEISYRGILVNDLGTLQSTGWLEYPQS